MKHHLLTVFVQIFLALPSFAQLTCDYIDPVCQKARELMNQGQYDQALRGLEKAKSDLGIRNCSDAYKIDDLISHIQKKRASNLCPDSNHPHLIDLGLPSGTKWACCNVGASRPEDYGGYYAWGETTTKANYDWTNYKWCQGAADKLTKYCTQSSFGTVDNMTVLEPADDAARANWGGSWRMPTYAQFQELLDKCTHVWTTVNGVNGTKFTGPNGYSIFLPAAGVNFPELYRQGIDPRGSMCGYRSSTLNKLSPDETYNMGSSLWVSVHVDSGYSRSTGLSVRPVR